MLVLIALWVWSVISLWQAFDASLSCSVCTAPLVHLKGSIFMISLRKSEVNRREFTAFIAHGPSCKFKDARIAGKFFHTITNNFPNILYRGSKEIRNIQRDSYGSKIFIKILANFLVLSYKFVIFNQYDENQIPSLRICIGQNAYCCLGAELLNELSQEAKIAPSLKIFKKSIMQWHFCILMFHLLFGTHC